MKKVVLLALVLIGNLAMAQYLEEKTSVLDKRNGLPLFELNEGESIYTSQPDEGWYKVSKKVWVDPANLADGKLLPSAKLLDKEGEVIGMTLSEVKAFEVKEVERYRGKDYQTAIIKGYVFKTKITDSSIPEERVEELLAMKNRREQMDGFADLFKKYQFEEREFEDLTVRVLRASNTTTSDESDFRLILIYRSETSLYAVITNDHIINAPKIKDEWEEDSFRIIYFYKPTPRQRELMDTILYTYMAL